MKWPQAAGTVGELPAVLRGPRRSHAEALYTDRRSVFGSVCGQGLTTDWRLSDSPEEPRPHTVEESRVFVAFTRAASAASTFVFTHIYDVSKVEIFVLPLQALHTVEVRHPTGYTHSHSDRSEELEAGHVSILVQVEARADYDEVGLCAQAALRPSTSHACRFFLFSALTMLLRWRPLCCPMRRPAMRSYVLRRSAASLRVGSIAGGSSTL